MLTFVPAFLQDNVDGAAVAALAGFSIVMFLIAMAIAAVCIAGLWKVFVKAGEPGWACIVPIYNVIVLLKIAGRPTWWVILYFIPFANIVVMILVAIDIGKAFGQTTAWSVVMLVILSAIGYLMLGFGNFRYLGPPVHAA